MSEPLHVAAVIATLGAGGAERVLSILANGLAQSGMTVSIITLGPTDHDFYPLDPTIGRVGLDVLSPSANWLDAIRGMKRRVSAIRGALENRRPDVVISFVDQTNVLVLMATRGLSIPVIVSERVDPGAYRIPAMYDFLRKRLYPSASCLVIQSRVVVPWAQSVMGKKERVAVFPDSGERKDSEPGTGRAPTIRVIPNPVRLPDESCSIGRDMGFPVPFIAAAGRLEKQKGFDRLVEAFRQVSDRFPDLNLVIAGEGSERERLEEQVCQAGLEERVELPGRLNDVFGMYRSAKAFVLSSRFEGFPNVLIEAMACGLPVVSYDCPSGPGEIIRDGWNGLLVKGTEPEDLAVALIRVLTDDALASKLSREARLAADRFSEQKILSEWIQAIRAAVQKHR